MCGCVCVCISVLDRDASRSCHVAPLYFAIRRRTHGVKRIRSRRSNIAPRRAPGIKTFVTACEGCLYYETHEIVIPIQNVYFPTDGEPPAPSTFQRGREIYRGGKHHRPTFDPAKVDLIAVRRIPPDSQDKFHGKVLSLTGHRGAEERPASAKYRGQLSWQRERGV